MQQLWLFFKSNHAFFLFVLLEIVAISFLVSRNQYQQAKFLQGSSAIQGSVNQKKDKVYDYFSLQKENELLATENQQLLQQLQQFETEQLPIHDTLQVDTLQLENDSIQINQFEFTVAKVISTPIHSSHKLFTINKGSDAGIEARNGVISPNGVVGKVVSTSKQFALVMPLTHLQLKLNIRHQASGYNGNLLWTGNNFTELRAENIPRNASVSVGDSIVTNQYSKSMPEGSFVGTVKQSKLDVSGNFYEITVQPGVDFSQLNFVYVVEQTNLDEMLELENTAR